MRLSSRRRAMSLTSDWPITENNNLRYYHVVELPKSISEEFLNMKDVTNLKHEDIRIPNYFPPPCLTNAHVEIAGEIFLDDNIFPIHIAPLGSATVDYDFCDGSMSMETRLVDALHGQRWIPRSLSEDAIVEAKVGDSDYKTIACSIAGSTDLVMLGFIGEEDDKVFYATTVNKGPVVLTSSGTLPEDLSEADAEDDPRVFRIYQSPESGKTVLQSAKYKKLFIIIKDGYVHAQEIEEKFATIWSLSPI